MKVRSSVRNVLACSCALFAANGALGLNILLTNDDGYQSPGINTLRDALCAAGHQVTMVAPAANQSGRGGSINTGALSSSSAMALTKHESDACGDVYSLAAPSAPGTYGGTPVDSLKAGLDVVLGGETPDLVVSGNNIGQNLGKPTSNNSGTIGAALQASYMGIPAIATSVGVNISEYPNYASTMDALAPAADFIVRLIAELEAAASHELMPHGTKLLNVNFPVPYANITGTAITMLGDRAELELPFVDRMTGLSCAELEVGESCSVGVGFFQVPGPDTAQRADTDAFRTGVISITPMDGDMTAGPISLAISKLVLRRLRP